MKSRFDVIVVGAGPGGSQAAEAIAKGGLSVAIIERKEWPSIPVRCGEGVGFKGMNASIGIKKEWILAEVKKVTFISPNNTRVDVHKIGESFCVDRTKMDRDLVEQAITAGATYINNTYIEGIETYHEDGVKMYRCVAEGKTFEAPLLVAADGVESRIKQFVGWEGRFAPEDMESCAFAKIKHPSILGDTIEFYVGEDIAPGGYLWVFPRGDGFANIGLGVLGTSSKPGMATRLLNKYIKENYDNPEVFDMHCGGVPVGHWTKPLVKEGVLLVGDSAAQVNALNGGGIAYALFAGNAAGEVIVEAFQNGSINYKHLQQYEKRWEKYCGKNQARSHALKNALLSRRDQFYNDLALALSKEDPHKLSYLKVFMRVFAKHPRLLLKTFFLFR